MRTFLHLLIILTLGLGLGGGLSWYSVQENHGFGALRIGGWTAWPLAGYQDADPYTRAKVAAAGEVPLGAAEGVAFHARLDDDGKPLQRECAYLVKGQTPPARLWTLTAHELGGAALKQANGSPSNAVSQQLLRLANGQFEVHVGPRLAAGNWVETRGSGPYEMVMRLYDTPISSNSGASDTFMPSIEALGCDR
ncbi:MAG: DUF1214 domain-containing protein [Pseudomonadota bacterium]